LTFEDAIAEHVGKEAPRSAADATPTGSEDSNEAYKYVLWGASSAGEC
jgi:hypothetical protein